MKLSHLQLSVREALRHRNFAYMVSGVLLLGNLGLTLKIWKQEEHWILIPQIETDHRLPLSSSQYSEAYVLEWADSLVRNFLTVNPQTVDRRLYELLLLAEQSSALQEYVKKEVKALKQDNVSTVFYPKEHSLNAQTQKVWVKGEHQTYFGRDKAPISREKTYVVTWKRGPRGVILLKDFYEETKDETQ